ncbi:MAG TPA: hypothetical protein VHS99_02850 [Chloroflexota bacterium]|nr:hypothetical protein [Chloroflexota bacterium]
MNLPRRRRFLPRTVLGACALLLAACRIGAPSAPSETGDGRRLAGAAPLRLGVPTVGPGGERAFESWKAAARRLREGGGPAVAVEAFDLQVPDEMALEADGRAPALAQLLAADPPLDGFVWQGGLPWERAALIRLGLLAPLDRYLRAPERRGAGHGAPLEAYHPGSLVTLRDGGHLFGLPLEAAPTLLLADFRRLATAPSAARALLDTGSGWPPGLPGQAGHLALGRWTWDAFEETVARLTRPASGPGDAGQWGFAPSTSLPVVVLLWQHGAEIDDTAGAPGAGPGLPGPPGPPGTSGAPGAPVPSGTAGESGGPRLRIDPAAARAALERYARLVRAALGPAAALSAPERPERQGSIVWSREALRQGEADVAMTLQGGLPRNWLATAPPPSGPAPSVPPVGFAPLPRLSTRYGRGDPAATLLRVRSFVAVSARAAAPSAAATALHGLLGLLDGDAVTLPARRPPAGQATWPWLAPLAPIERTAISEALAHGQVYPPRVETTLEAYLGGRVAGPLQQAPGRAAALEEALAALLRIGA